MSEVQTDGRGRDLLQFNRIDTALTEHTSGIDRLEAALGQSLGIPTSATRARKQGGGKGVSMADRMEVVEW